MNVWSALVSGYETKHNATKVERVSGKLLEQQESSGADARIHPPAQEAESSSLLEGLMPVQSLLAPLNLSELSFNFSLAPCSICLQFQVIITFRQYLLLKTDHKYRLFINLDI